jgi:hypothetical protein
MQKNAVDDLPKYVFSIVTVDGDEVRTGLSVVVAWESERAMTIL